MAQSSVKIFPSLNDEVENQDVRHDDDEMVGVATQDDYSSYLNLVWISIYDFTFFFYL